MKAATNKQGVDRAYQECVAAIAEYATASSALLTTRIPSSVQFKVKSRAHSWHSQNASTLAFPSLFRTRGNWKSFPE
jgi:hypothetical protein